MTLTDGLVVLGIFGGLGYMIWIKLDNKNSGFTQKTRDWLRKTKINNTFISKQDKLQQTHNEKRQIM